MGHTRGVTKARATAQVIGDALINAIAEQRIAPGTRLVEEELGRAFGVSRTVVRQALTQLAVQGFVAVRSRQGWFVIESSEAEVRQAFAARRLIEATLVREFVRVATARQVEALRRHLHEQHDAVDHENAPRRTRLLGDFHVQIADMLGNEHLVRIVTDLVTRTNLMAMLYQSQQEASHSAQEHEDIVRAIESGEAEEAVRLMEEHLRSVEAGLKHRKDNDPVARLLETLDVKPAPSQASRRAGAARTKRPEETEE